MRNRVLLAVGTTLTLVSAGAFVGCSNDTNGTGPDLPATDGGTGDVKVDAPNDADGGPDGDGGGTCPTVSFVKPTDNAALSETDDADGDCGNGVQSDVTVATSAPDGTTATLSGANKQFTATVTNAVAKFTGVSFPVGATTLSVQVGTSSKCSATAHVTATCAGKPSCTISQPVISATHPALAMADDVAAAGNPFQAAFEVTTTAEDGQQVQLQVDNGVIYPATVSGGKATYAGVTLSPDGSHDVKATCTAKVGGSSSDTKTFLVDSTPPDLAVTGVADGKHFGPSDDVDPNTNGLQFQVCGTTGATDALDVTQGPSPNPNNFCTAIGTSSPTCAPASASTSSGACVMVTCPGGAPFDLTVTLYDEAGNATTKTIQGVSCASTNPSVQIVDPTDGTGADATKHILAADQTQARRDNNPNKPGAQYDVTACTDAATGKATLKLGLAGGALATWNTTPVDVVAAQPSDNCPSGLGYVAKFAGVDLPESDEDNAGKLNTATELVVDVEDESLATGSSPAVDVWVDSAEPTLQPSSPSPLCGKLYQSASDVTTDVKLFTTAVPVDLTVTNTNGTQTYNAATFSFNNTVTFTSVAFAQGSNEVQGSVTEPSGNNSHLPSSCTVTVGNPPVVSWVAPAAGTTQLNASTDGDTGAAGWQGALQACVDAATVSADPSTTIQFSTDLGGAIGTPLTIDGSGCVSLPSATVPEGDAVKLVATTSNVPGKGVGTATLALTVDMTAPDAVTGLAASILDRRQTKFRVAWTAPSDGGSKPVATYDVRWSKKPIASAADFAAATQVPYTGSPAAPGSADGIDVGSLTIENDYYFAVVAKDKAGNSSSMVTAGPAQAKFNATILQGSSAEMLGFDLDGSSDFNGDGYSDLLVGAYAGTKAYIYFGSATGFKATPDITFAGSTSEFGIAARVVGDIDSDGLPDVAIGSDVEQKVYVFFGSKLKALTTFPATLTATSADAIISVDAGADAKFGGAVLGTPIARIGDFNGDGADDFAVAAVAYDSQRGYVGIVFGVPKGQPFPTSVVFPTDVGTKAAAITGSSTGERFGWQIVGLGSLYPGQGSTIVIGASRWNSKAGRAYAFVGPLSGTAAADTAAKSTIEGSASTLLSAGLAFLGHVGTNSGLMVGAPWTTPSGSVRAYFGSGATGPFGNLSGTLTNSAATGTNDAFGYAIEAGAFSGTATTTSFLGDATPDVAISGYHENGASARIYIVDGKRLNASFDVVSGADVVYPFPSDWASSAFYTSGIKDSNNDGYGDLAFGEYLPSGTKNGRVLVLW